MDQPCLVVGGGEVAARKTTQLLQAKARVTIVSPEICGEMQRLIDPERCEWQQRLYLSPEAREYRLVIATTNDEAVNRRIFEDCENSSIPVNVVDQPELCSVIFPAIIRHGSITLAISSSGKIPFYTRSLRAKLERFLQDQLPVDRELMLIKFREFVKSNVTEQTLKIKLYDRMLDEGMKIGSKWSIDHPPYDLWTRWIEEERNR